MSRKRITILLGLTLIVAILPGCCTPQAVKELSQQVMTDTEKLSEAHNQALLTTSKRIDELSRRQGLLFAKIEDLTRQAFSHRLNAMEHKLISSFDDKAWTILGTDFETQLEELYWKEINEFIDNRETALKTLREQLKQHPDDMNLRLKVSEKQADMRTLEGYAAAGEANLRKKATENLLAARQEIIGQIEQRLAALREQVAGLNQSSGSAGPISAILAAEDEGEAGEAGGTEVLRGELESFRLASQEAFDQHLKALTQLDDYLNRPSAIKLIVAGAIGELKSSLSQLPIPKDLTAGLLSQVTKLEGLAASAENSLMNLIETKGNELLKKATESISGTGHEVTNDPWDSSNG